MIRETACQFGDKEHLCGILTAPATAAPKSAVMLVSAGLAPKYGPFRLYAQLARRLADEGHLALRFDLGGIGDSQQPDLTSRLKVRTEQDIRAAIDHLTQAHSIERVTLAGLCSGAEDSFRHAEVDPRVTSVVMIDPFAYPTAGFRWRKMLVQTAKKALSALRLHRRPAPTGSSNGQLVDYRYIERSESERILGRLIQRKVSVHFIYTGGMSASFNHKGQLSEMFRGLPLGDRVTVEHLPRLGHTQLLAADREVLIDSVARRSRAL